VEGANPSTDIPINFVDPIPIKTEDPIELIANLALYNLVPYALKNAINI